MNAAGDYRRVLSSYPEVFSRAGSKVEYLGSAGGFSGAKFWRIDTSSGKFCLRRWPAEHPTVDRLEFIQAVLWHVQQEGFSLAPLPVETQQHAGYVWHGDHFWELSPWLAGQADFAARPSRPRLQAAMAALAQFHLAAASFPLPVTERAKSPGIEERLKQLRSLLGGEFWELEQAIDPAYWPEMALRARRLAELFPAAAGSVMASLSGAAALRVSMQPCIRDIWHDHVLFQGEQVSGLVDFGAMRPENVAADVARLLGSLVGDDEDQWQAGLDAYEAVRPLTAAELQLTAAFDRSSVLMSGLSWVRWIFLERRQFEHPGPILSRLDSGIARLTRLAMHA